MLKSCEICGKRAAIVKVDNAMMCGVCESCHREAMREINSNADPVNRPAHYMGDIECVDAIRAALGDEGLRFFCLGNAMKYIWRADRKGARDQDMAKALWYLRMAAGDDPRKERQ